MKRIISTILIISICMCLTINVSAHTQVQNTVLDEYTDSDGRRYYVGAESIGWIIDEYSHIGTTSITYHFDSSVPAKYKTMFRSAAASWETYTQATVTEVSSTSANVLVKYKALASTTCATSQTSITGVRNYHSTSWIININNNNIAVEHDLIHEIGHVFGLNDLHNISNKNKLMYIKNTRTATHPTSYDIKGFNVITGLHSNHTSWKYSNTAKWCATCGGIKTFDEAHNFRWSPYSSATHKGYCPVCKLTVYENHSYYLSGSTCTRCGSTNTGGGTVSIPDEELVE